MKVEIKIFGVAVLGLFFLGFGKKAHAVDFKIDVPLKPVVNEKTSEGARPKPKPTFTETELDDAPINAEEVSQDFGFIIPEMPAVMPETLVQPAAEQAQQAVTVEPTQKESSAPSRSQVTRKGNEPLKNANGAKNTLQVNGLNGTRIYETGAFPVPRCLEPNVAFWKKIYREIDVNEALVHDRDDLSRIFGKVTLPPGLRQRNNAVKAARLFIEEQLEELAQSLARGKALTSDEQSLLAVFSPADQNAQSVREAASRIRVQSGLKTRFEAGVMRSLEYLPTISTILENAGVPKDIVHLPHVESSYVRTAHSKVGAVGLWQIMPGTMRILKGRQAVGRRTEVVLSTQAAAQLLQQNYRLLGSWPLALTAYNHGPAGVSRAVRATGSKDLCTIIERYQSPSFRFASSNFYAQFLAARHVALDKYQQLSNSDAHGRMLQPLLAHALREKL